MTKTQNYTQPNTPKGETMSKGMKAAHGASRMFTEKHDLYGSVLNAATTVKVLTAYTMALTPMKRLPGCGKTRGVNNVAREMGIRYSEAVRLVRICRLTGALPGDC